MQALFHSRRYGEERHIHFPPTPLPACLRAEPSPAAPAIAMEECISGVFVLMRACLPSCHFTCSSLKQAGRARMHTSVPRVVPHRGLRLRKSRKRTAQPCFTLPSSGNNIAVTKRSGRGPSAWQQWRCPTDRQGDDVERLCYRVRTLERCLLGRTMLLRYRRSFGQA